jgi:hypothetical protein
MDVQLSVVMNCVLKWSTNRVSNPKARLESLIHVTILPSTWIVRNCKRPHGCLIIKKFLTVKWWGWILDLVSYGTVTVHSFEVCNWATQSCNQHTNWNSSTRHTTAPTEYKWTPTRRHRNSPYAIWYERLDDSATAPKLSPIKWKITHVNMREFITPHPPRKEPDQSDRYTREIYICLILISTLI